MKNRGNSAKFGKLEEFGEYYFWKEIQSLLKVYFRTIKRSFTGTFKNTHEKQKTKKL